MDNAIKKKKYRTSLFTAIFIFVAAVAIIGLNVVLVYNMSKEQTEATGKQQISSLTSNLQSILNEASYQTENIAEEVRRLLEKNCSVEELQEYITEQSERQKNLTSGNCFNVCFTSSDLIIVPGYDVAEDFDLTTRSWYIGLKNNKDGGTYISSPYVDLATDSICFTVAVLLEDNDASISLDFKLVEIQNIISGMNYEGGTAILVNTDGMVVSSTEDVKPGSDIGEAMPQYADIFERIVDSEKVNDIFEKGGYTAFYNCTANDWYMIYVIDRLSLYHDSYITVFRNAVIGLLLLILIAMLVIKENKRSKQVEEAISARDEFFGSLSDELSVPIKQIMHNCNPNNLETEDGEQNIKNIREAAFKLSGVIDNMFAYSGILAADKKSESKKNLRRLSKQERKSGISVARLNTILLVVIFLITCIFSQFMLMEQASNEMNREISKYTSLLTSKMSSQFTTFDVMAAGFKANPRIIEDTEKTTQYLKKMTEDFADISLVYIGNAENDQTVIMSDGWMPGSNYILEAYSWYSDACDKNGECVLSVPFFDTDSRTYCITLSGALYDDNGDFIGVLGIDFRLDSITGVLTDDDNSGGYAFLVTNNGTIVNHPNRDYAISTSNKQSIDELNYYKAFPSDDYVGIIDYDGSWSLCMEYNDSVSGFHIVVVNSVMNLLGGMLIGTAFFLVFTLVCIIMAISFMIRNTHINEDQKARLKEAMEQAQSADEAKSRFLALISHELRTPINAINGMNEMILRSTEDEEVLGYSRDLGASCSGLLSIVNEVLDYSKLENGKMELIEVEYSIENLIHDTVSTVEDRARKAGLRLVLDIDEELPMRLYGDETHIRQVLINLMTNAIKYTNEGYVKLKISSRKQSEDIQLITFLVDDSGIGIKPEDLKKLTESYSRLDLGRNRNVEGTGLGLYIVNQFLKLMNSRLEVSSTYGRGSTFSFTLLQRVVDGKPIGSYSEKKKVVVTQQSHKIKRYLYAPEIKILVVDDNEINLKVACGLLKRSLAQVFTVTGGRECLEFLKEQNVDLILMDHMMPEMDGIQTLAAIKEQKLTEAPVIVMTANAISSFRDEYTKAGFDDFLAKPIVPDLFESVLAKWLPEDKVSFLSKEEAELKAMKADNNQESKKEDKELEDYGPFTEKEVTAFKTYAPEINFMEGMHSCGDDKDFYFEIVSDYMNSTTVPDLLAAYEQENVKNYQVKVHALKSTSRSIGAAELGEEAYELELAAKEGNIELIKSKNEALITHYRSLVEKLKKVFETK